MAKHSVFICFSSKDEALALRVVDFLESRGLKCWISARDVQPGQNYQESIVHALEAAKALVFLFSENSNQSGEIRKELSLAASGQTPVIPLRLSDVTPTTALRYELATRQWVNAFPKLEEGLERLVAGINDTLNGGQIAADVRPPAATKPAAAPPAPVREAPAIELASEDFEALRSLLARHIGPIARIMLQKAVGNAHSVQDLCEQLAAHVQKPAERAAFLQAARGRFAGRS